MKCIYCGSEQSSVIDKRAVKSSGEIRRRRECLKCHSRYTTYEKVCELELLVIKRDGRKEAFSKDKLKAGLLRALEKRPAGESIDLLMNDVMKRLKLKGVKEIESKAIGKAVCCQLKKTDPVAYLRFVSVYRQFQDPMEFSKELAHLRLEA